ncbi:MAG: hypothetical protein ABSC51_09180 [Gaiellaceae bacterium]
MIAGIVFHLAYRYDPICRALECFRQSSSYVTTAQGREVSYKFPALTDDLLRDLLPPSTGLPTGVQLWDEPAGVHRVQVVATIANTGRFGVTIDSVGLPSGLLNVHSLRTSFYKAGSVGANAGALLHPFSLPAHSSRLVVIDYVQNCVPSTGGGAVSGVDALSVRYSFLGFEHMTSAIIGGYAFSGPKRC